MQPSDSRHAGEQWAAGERSSISIACQELGLRSAC